MQTSEWGGGKRTHLSAHTVNGSDKVRVRNRRVSAFDSPHGLAQVAYGGGRVEDDLGAVEAESHPVEGMVAAVADVDGDLSECGFENGMTYTFFS